MTKSEAKTFNNNINAGRFVAYLTSSSDDSTLNIDGPVMAVYDNYTGTWLNFPLEEYNKIREMGR
jgi:hypothetical protein